MAEGVVDGAKAECAAADVGDGDQEGLGGARRRVHFETVAEHHQQIGPERLVGFGETADAQAHGMGDAAGRVRGQREIDPRRRREAVGQDFLESVAEGRLQVHAGGDQQQLQVGAFGDAAQQRPIDAVVGAGDGDDGNSPHVSRRLMPGRATAASGRR